MYSLPSSVSPAAKCCGVNLKTGARVLGYINILIETYMALLVLDWMNDTYETNRMAKIFHVQNWSGPTEIDFAIYVTTFSLSTLSVVFCIFLIAGTLQNSRPYVAAYIWHNVVYIIISFLLFFGASTNLSNVLNNRHKFFMFLLITRVTPILTLPVACFCYFDMGAPVHRTIYLPVGPETLWKGPNDSLKKTDKGSGKDELPPQYADIVEKNDQKERSKRIHEEESSKHESLK